MTKRLGIIGCGSSGLITLKVASEHLPDWEVVAFEATDSITGCWGYPYDGFASTSTRFTTQFACFPKFDGKVEPGGAATKVEFFRDGEYGRYLDQFADHFQLRQQIRLRHSVAGVVREDGGWRVELQDPQAPDEWFDAIVVCTGLAEKPNSVSSTLPQLTGKALNRALADAEIQNRTVVVMGGGESAVDFANRLATPAWNNRVYLSLKSGIRVSPRYHPVRGVPSDFLRNRLMLSAHADIRNAIGQFFVRSRIKYERWFRWCFPPSSASGSTDKEFNQRRQDWALWLTEAAKDDLFNMFHNKSDDFLRAVGEQRIRILGPAVDENYQRWSSFPFHGKPPGEQDVIELEPDLLVPAIGFQTGLESRVTPKVSLDEFYMGCLHQKYDDLFLVGFARPIIGNIPTISEMQAQYVCRTLAGLVQRPDDLPSRNLSQRESLRRRHPWLDQTRVYPVEMFPYCDQLAAAMKLNPIPSFFSSPRSWLRAWLQPATTLQYFRDQEKAKALTEETPIYMPLLLVLLILLVKPIDWGYRWFRS